MFYTPFDREFEGDHEYVFLEFFEPFFPSKNQKNSEGVENAIFRLFLFKLNFPSSVTTWTIQTNIFLCSFEN